MKKIFYLLLCLQLVLGCSPKVSDKNHSELAYKPKYAKLFEIRFSGDTTIIVTNPSFKGSKSREYSFVDPKERVVCLSSSHTAFIEALGGDDKIVGVSGGKFLHSPTMREKQEVGYDQNFAFETIVSLKPDVMSVYEIAGESSASMKKLEQMHLELVYIADYLETHPLAKAEWIVVMGALIGKQTEAIEIFEGIAQRYNKVCESLKNIDKRPRVMLNSPYKDTWYLPGGESYMIQLIEDAGGEYVADYLEGSEARAVSYEKAYELLLGADVWLNPSNKIYTRDQLMRETPHLREISIPIYSNVARRTDAGGSDFWENGVVRPDIVLMDLVAILHPQNIENHELYYHCPIE